MTLALFLQSVRWHPTPLAGMEGFLAAFVWLCLAIVVAFIIWRICAIIMRRAGVDKDIVTVLYLIFILFLLFGLLHFIGFY